MTGTPPRRSAPRASVSAGALQRNARRAAAGTRDPVVDLRRDAWGHGIDVVAAAVADAGIRRAIVDASGVDAAIAAGLSPLSGAVAGRPIDGVDPADGAGPFDGVAPVDRPALIENAVLFGFPGAGGEQVLTYVGPVLSTKPLSAGDGVSYGYTHRARHDTMVALVAGGYAEGVVRALGNHSAVRITGVDCPIVGRVAMDVCVVDIGDLPVAAGEEAVYFGTGGAPDGLLSWCRATGMTAAELVCAIGLRAAREVVA